ncbi:MAG: phosphate signaling complex protein PhoU [Gammaproteobacteria bacterium]|nr:phosphate signaling complex protein PhoU [Gammaproteobacteria bacterium]
MVQKHISEQFNEEMDDIRNQVLTMGGFVEAQVRDACEALMTGDITLAQQVIHSDAEVNSMEKGIDGNCVEIIARRQPTAGDLRLIMSLHKVITDLERVGDEASKIALMALELAEMGRPRNECQELTHLAEHVRKELHDALDSLARMDIRSALDVASEDDKVDKEYEAVTRQLITLIMENPSNVSRVLNTLWAARALERIGDHAKNLCEYTIYVVTGEDVRHRPLGEDVKKALLS